MPLIIIKDGVTPDELTKNLIVGFNTLAELWDSEDVISADVITDENLYEEELESKNNDEDIVEDFEGISECTVLVEIPNAEYSLMLIQDEDDEDCWYVATCNCSYEDPRSIDRMFEIDKSSLII